MNNLCSIRVNLLWQCGSSPKTNSCSAHLARHLHQRRRRGMKMNGRDCEPTGRIPSRNLKPHRLWVFWIWASMSRVRCFRQPEYSTPRYERMLTWFLWTRNIIWWFSFKRGKQVKILSIKRLPATFDELVRESEKIINGIRKRGSAWNSKHQLQIEKIISKWPSQEPFPETSVKWIKCFQRAVAVFIKNKSALFIFAF